MNLLISAAIARPLQLADLNLTGTSPPQEVRAFCDSFARLLVQRYLTGDLSWSDADAAANHIFDLMVQHCGDRTPDLAWDVYLAFDAGECTAPGGDAVTRPLVEGILRKFAVSDPILRSVLEGDSGV
ncbi:MAG: hypothetical protein WDO56_06345 [Gammaproteobacteria bacterium]